MRQDGFNCLLVDTIAPIVQRILIIYMCLDNPPCDINAIDKIALVTNTQHIAADGGLIETSLMLMRLKTYRTNSICLMKATVVQV